MRTRMMIYPCLGEASSFRLEMKFEPNMKKQVVFLGRRDGVGQFRQLSRGGLREAAETDRGLENGALGPAESLWQDVALGN